MRRWEWLSVSWLLLFFSVDGPCTPTARSPAGLQEVDIRGRISRCVRCMMLVLRYGSFNIHAVTPRGRPAAGGIVHSGTDVWRVSVIWVQNCAGALNTVTTGLPCCKQGLRVCTGMALRPAWSQLSVMRCRKGQKCT